MFKIALHRLEIFVRRNGTVLDKIRLYRDKHAAGMCGQYGVIIKTRTYVVNF